MILRAHLPLRFSHLCVCALLFAILPTSVSEAQGREEAARALAEQGRLAEARALLVEELQDSPSPSVAFNLALIEHSAGDFEEAESLFGRLLGGEFGELPEERRTRTVEFMARSTAELGTLVIHWQGASEGTLRIDGRPRGALVPGETIRLRLNPVQHIVSLRAGGIERAQEVTLTRGTSHEVTFGQPRVESPEPEEPDTNPEIINVPDGGTTGPDDSRPIRRSPWLWIAIGLVAVGGVTAAVLLTRDGGAAPALPDSYIGRVEF